MPFPGPWIDPGEMWIAVPTRIGQVDIGPPLLTAAAAANAASPLTTVTVPPNGPVATAKSTGNPDWQYDQSTIRVQFNQSDLLFIPTLTPPGALGAELETNVGVVIGPTSLDLTVASTATGPGTDMSATNWNAYDADGWTPGSTLVALTPRATLTFADVAASIGIDLADYTLSIHGPGDDHYTHSLLFTADRQAGGTPLVPPATFTDTDKAQLAILTANVSVWCHPPRYRWLYNYRPPLAHRQRRDGTATAGAQLAHIGTSGARPPLAHRQNHP